MKKVKFPEMFYPEITDLYDKKNMPRVIYCIHGLSRYLYHLGIAPEMEDLQGVAQFTEAELTAMEQELQKAGVQMPAFNKIGGVLAKELGQDEAASELARGWCLAFFSHTRFQPPLYQCTRPSSS
jgi:hypothetical protein